MKYKIYINLLVNILLIIACIAAVILIIVKLCNLKFVEHIDATLIVAIPAIVIAYLTFKINSRQANLVVVAEYNKHMEDFFTTWSTYKNSLLTPKNIGLLKDEQQAIGTVIPNYNDLKNKLAILYIKSETFESNEIKDAMANYWKNFLASEKALRQYITYDKEVKKIEYVYDDVVDQMVLDILEKYKSERGKCYDVISNNVMFFDNDGPDEMRKAYQNAIKRLVNS